MISTNIEARKQGGIISYPEMIAIALIDSTLVVSLYQGLRKIDILALEHILRHCTQILDLVTVEPGVDITLTVAIPESLRECSDAHRIANCRLQITTAGSHQSSLPRLRRNQGFLRITRTAVIPCARSSKQVYGRSRQDDFTSHKILRRSPTAVRAF